MGFERSPLAWQGQSVAALLMEGRCPGTESSTLFGRILAQLAVTRLTQAWPTSEDKLRVSLSEVSLLRFAGTQPLLLRLRRTLFRLPRTPALKGLEGAHLSTLFLFGAWKQRFAKKPLYIEISRVV